MIKKIYDRDTGNIYDVGADNKLKLAYENLDFENNIVAENHNELFIPITNELNENKLYWIELLDEIGYTYNTILKCATQNGVLINDNNDNYSIMVTVQLFKNEITISCYAAEQEGNNTFQNKQFGVKIYELPFSM